MHRLIFNGEYMKRKILFVALTSLILMILLFTCACGNNQGTDTNTDTGTQGGDTEGDAPTEITYTVRVVDYKGNPVTSGLFIQLYNNGHEIGSMKKANSNGEASFVLPQGEYTYELILTDDKIEYDKENVTLTKEKPTKEVMLYSLPENKNYTIYPFDSETQETYQYNAKFVGEGATLVDINGISYYVFQPTRGGVYKFSYICDSQIMIGYYGGSEHYVAKSTLTDPNPTMVVINGIRYILSQKSQNGNKTTYIGIDEELGEEIEVAIDNSSKRVTFTLSDNEAYEYTYTFTDGAMTLSGKNSPVASIACEYKEFTIEVKDTGISSAETGTTRVIIGLSASSKTSAILTVERISDPAKEIPKMDYLPVEVPKTDSNYSYLNLGLKDVDITDKELKIVYGQDKLFHLGTEDGPIVLVRIASDNKYRPSFATMCETAALCGTIKDENGNTLRIEVYNDLVSKYAEKCDDAGVTPLTKEILYAINNIASHNSWFEGEGCIFKVGGGTDEDGNVIEGTLIDFVPENAQYFACCYLEPNGFGTEEKRVQITDSASEKDLLILAEAQSSVYVKSTRQIKSTLVIKNAQNLTVLVGGEEFLADEDGVITIIFDGTAPIEFTINNVSTNNEDVVFTFTTYTEE